MKPVCKVRLLALALLLLFWGGSLAILSPITMRAAAERAPLPSRLSGQGETLLRTIVDSGRLSDLRWPDFSDRRDEVKEFYEPAPYTLAWVKGAKTTWQARQIIALFQTADGKGLRVEDYDGLLWSERFEKLNLSKPAAQESDWIHFDLALTISAIRYISDLHAGRVNPQEVHLGFHINHGDHNVAAFLRERVVNAPDVGSVVQTVEPGQPAYQRTLAALKTYRELARLDDGEPLPAPNKNTRSIKPGEPYPGVPRLVRLLTLLGDLPSEVWSPPDQIIYEGGVVKGVKHFQARHGLEPDGVIGKLTLSALDIPLSYRIVQLELALERWRWLPREFPEPRIIVNVPEFRVYAYDAEFHPVLSTKVIVGRAYRQQTPIFTSQMQYVILRPPWNVPFSIQRKEMIPEITKNPNYLVEKGYEIVGRDGSLVSKGIVNEDILSRLRTGDLGIRQPPGPQNALGLIKFEFANDYNVYMHGTPAMSLFSKAQRDFSHGCIRVEDPLALAAWVLRENREWPVERMRAAMEGQETIWVKLDKPIPVLILYNTAAVTESGGVRFFGDLYKHDAVLERAMARAYSPHPPVEDKK